MEVIDSREQMIFRSERDGKISYAVGLSKKKDDGTYERGFMPVRFRKDTDIKDRTKIKIKEAWLDFYKIDKRTMPYIFINKFDMADDFEAIKQVSGIPPKEKTYLEQQQNQDLGEYPFY